MTKDEFKSLKVKDIVIIRSGFDDGKKAVVVWWYNNTVVVRALDGERFGERSRMHDYDLKLVDFKLLKKVEVE